MLIYLYLLSWVILLPNTNGQLSYQPLDLDAMNKMLNDHAKKLLEKMEMGFESVVNRILQEKSTKISPLNETMGRREPAWTDATSDFYHPYSFNKFGGSRTELTVETLFLERRVELLDKAEPTDFTMIQVDQIKIFVGASSNGLSLFWITATEQAFVHYEAIPGIISLEYVVLPNPVTNSTDVYLLLLRVVNTQQSITMYRTSPEEHTLVRVTNDLNVVGDVVRLKHIRVPTVDVDLVAAVRVLDAKTGNSSTTSTIYKLKLINGKLWMYELLPLASLGAMDMEAFTINGVTYVAVANSFCEVSDVFIFDAETNHFHLYQRLPLANATQFVYFQIGYHHYLAGIGRDQAVIFAWEGEGLVLLQSIYAPREPLPIDVRRWHPMQTVYGQALLLLVRSSHTIDVLKLSRASNRFVIITEPMCLDWIAHENRTGNYAYTSSERFSDLNTAQQHCIWNRQNCLGVSKIPDGNKEAYVIEPGKEGYIKNNPVSNHYFWTKELREGFTCFTLGATIGRASIVSFSDNNLLFVTIPLGTFTGGFVFILREITPQFISETASALASLRNIQERTETLEQRMSRGMHRMPPSNAMVLNKNQDIVAELTFDAELSTSNAFDVDDLEVTNIEGDEASLGRYDVTFNEIDVLIKKILQRLDDSVPVNKPVITIPKYMHFLDVEAAGNLTSTDKATVGFINGVNVNELYNNAVLSANDKVRGQKVFTNAVNVFGNVSVSGPIHGKHFPKDILTTNSPQNMTGTWYFEEPVAVVQTVHLNGRLNGIDLSKSVVSTSQPNRTTPYTGRKIFVDDLIVKGDVNVAIIDGVDIGHIIKTAVTKSGNQEITAPKTFRKAVRVKGNVNLKGLVNNMDLKRLDSRIVKPNEPVTITGCKTFLRDVYIEGGLIVNGHLKGRNIPSDFVFHNSTPTISGRKIFVQNVKVKGNVFVDKQVDGISLQTAVTVNTQQIIPGKKLFRGGATFLNLEVGGTIDSTSIDRLLHLLATQDSLTSDNVKEYDTVNISGSLGPIKFINGIPVDSLLADIVLKTDKNVVMEGPKSYRQQSVVNGKIMRLNKLNNLDLKKDFLTKTNSHHVRGKKIFTKSVVFDSLTVDGLVDNVNVSQFVKDIVRLDNPQDIGGHKTFIDGMEIRGPLLINGRVDSVRIPEDVINKVNPQPINSRKTFVKGVKGEQLYVDDLIIRNSLNGIDWRSFNEKRVTLSSPQDISGHMKLKDSVVINGDLQISNQVNGIDLRRLTEDAMRKSVPQVVTGPKNFAGQMTVQGDLLAYSGLDGVDLPKLNSLAVKVDDEIQNSYIFSNLIAREGIKLEGKFGEVDLKDLVDDVVWKNVPQTITGIKNIGDFAIQGQLTLARWNGIDVNRILSKTMPQRITGPYIFNGNVFVHGNLIIQGNLNRENLQEFAAKTMKIVGDVKFPNVIFTSDLQFDHHLNASTINNINLLELAKKAVIVDAPQTVRGHKEFKGRLIAKHNIQMIGTVNGKSLKEFASDVVLTSGNQIIKGMKTFAADIDLYGDLKVEGNVSLQGAIEGVRLEDIDRDVVFVHKSQKITGAKIFTKPIKVMGNFNLKKKLNGINIPRDVVTRKGHQTISGVKTFHQIEVNGEVAGDLINGHHLPSVVADTLKIGEPQDIIGLKTFTQQLTFNADVDIDGRACGLDFGREVVTLDTPQIITGEKKFMDKFVVKGNADLERINSFELSRLSTLWNINIRNYSADYNFLGSVKFVEEPQINTPLEAVNNFEKSVSKLPYVQPDLQAAYNTTISTCNMFSRIVNVAKNAAVKPDHFEYVQTLDVAQPSGFYHFSINGTEFLIVGLPLTFCQADRLYKWDSNQQSFIRKDDLPQGVATSRHHFIHNNQHYLVMAHMERKCGKLSRLLKFDPTQEKFVEHCNLELGIASLTTVQYEHKLYFIATTGSKALVFALSLSNCKISPISANGPCNAASTSVKKITMMGQMFLVLGNLNRGTPTKICRFLNGSLELIQELDTQLVNSMTIIDAYQKYLVFSQATRITKFTDATMNSIQVYKMKLNGGKVHHYKELYVDTNPVLGLESFQLGPRMKPYIINLKRKGGISVIPLDGFSDVDNTIHLPMTRSSHMHSFTIAGYLYIVLNEVDDSKRATIYRLITKGVAVGSDLKCNGS